jgi:hypothetical protein
MAEIRDESKYAQLQELKNPGAPSFQLTPTVKQAMANRLTNTGNSILGPNQVKPQDYTKVSGREFLEREISSLKANLSSANNPFAYAKGVAFNAEHTGKNFDRYYNHANFKKLGFSPFRDNEKLYNDNSTWADDFGRASSQYGTLVGTGISSMFKNWGSLMSSAPDTDSAWEMEKAMAIGMSSKEGFGAGFTNFYLNSAYTVGILGEIALEEVALGLATAATGGGAGGLAIARSAQNVGRFSKGLVNLFKSADKINDARNLLTGAGKGALNFLNPVENLTEFAKGVKVGEKGQMLLRNADDGFDAVTKSFLVKQGIGAGIKDLRAINAVSSEAKLEAGMVQGQVANNLINKFYEENGRMPEGKEADFISSRAKEAGAKTFMANLGGIYISNKIVLETALKGFKPLRNVIDDAGSDFLHAINRTKAGGKTVSLVDKNSLGKYFKKDYYKAVGQSMTPKKILGSSLRYTSANLAEGAQELYQESLSAGLIDHYTNNHLSGKAGEADIWDALTFGSGELDKNDQGLEIFLSGFAMGGALGPVQNLVFNKGGKAFGYAKDYFQGTKTMEEAKKNRDAIKSRLEKSLTAIVNDPSKFASALSENVKLQDDFVNLGADAEGRGDKKGANDAKDDSMFNHVHTLLQHGMYDVFVDQLKDLKNLKADEMASAFGNNDESNVQADEFNKDIYGRIDSAVSRAKGIKERYDNYTKKYRNPFNKNNPEEYLDWLGFEQTRKMAIFSDYTFDRAAKRMQGVFDYLNKVSPLKQSEAGRITSLLDDSMLDNEIKRLEDEVKIYGEAADSETKAKGKARQGQLSAIKDLRAAMINYRASYDQAKQAAVKPELEEEMRTTRKVFTAGSTVEFQKNGKAVQGTVFKSTAKGNIIVDYKDNKGETKREYIDKSKLAVVGESSQTDEDFESPQTNFVSESRDLMFEAYKKYLETIAEETGDFLNNDNIQKSFAGLLDHIELRDDASKMSEQVAKFLDPEFFAMSSERMSTALKQAQVNAKAKLSKQLEDFLNREVQNDLFNSLDEIKVFFNPEEIDAFIKDGIVPNNFLDAESLTVITPSDPRYKQILDLLDKYEEVTGKTLSGKPLAELEALEGRVIAAKKPEDKRTIADIATALGFDPKKGGAVKVTDLLNYIISSDNASEADKKLAQRLVAIVDPAAIALIEMDHGTYSSYDSTNGLVIDPRFSTADYKQGNIKFEYSALSGIMKMVTDNALTDPEFEAKINILLEQVKTAVSEGRVNNALQALGYDPTNIYGLESASDFIAESITNPAFQQLLENITVENTEKNLWEDVLQAIKDVLKKILGVRDNNTALTQALSIISNKFDPSGVGFAKTVATQAAANAPSVATPFDEMPDDLKAILSQMYQGVPEDMEAWIQNSTEARNLINAYNRGTNQAPQTTPQPQAGAQPGPQAISEKQKLQLKSLGYTSVDINNMSYDEAVKIIGAGTKKSAAATTTTPKPTATPQQQTFDTTGIERMTQDEFAFYLQSLIQSNQINLTQKQVYDLLTVRPELREAKLNESDTEWSKRFVTDPAYKNAVNVIDNNKEMKGTANPAWVGITINDPTNKEKDGRHKGYVTISAASIDNFATNVLTTVEDLFNELKAAGYNGHLKMPSSRNGLVLRFDNIVIHGASQADVALALPIIEKYLTSKGMMVEGTKTGIDKNNTSHTDLLAEDVINNRIKNPNVPTVDRAEELRKEIAGEEDRIKSLYNFIAGTDSNAAIVATEKQIKEAQEKLKALRDELTELEKPKSKPGEQLSLFDEGTVVIESLRGKVIYTSPGMNIDEATRIDPFIVNGDALIAEELAENTNIDLFKDTTLENITRKIAEFYSELRKPNSKFTESDALDVQAAFNRAFNRMKLSADEGYTYLTHALSLLQGERTQLDLVITPTDSSVYQRGETEVLQIKQRREAELASKAKKIHRVTDATSIIDVLTGKAPLKNSKTTVTDKNFIDQVNEVTSISTLADLEYEMSFMSNAELADIGVTRDEAVDILKNRLDELSSTPDFDAIKEGDILIDKDGVLLYVTYHNYQTGEMNVRPVGTKQKGEKLTFTNYKNRIKAIFVEGMNIQSQKPTVTPEEQKTAEENIEASVSELDLNLLREIEKDIDTDTKAALDDINLC